MKTLDEVIKAYEICLNINETSCRGCPYTEFNVEGKWACSLCGDCTEDALSYLKEYQKVDSNWSEKAISELNNIADANFLRAYREDKDELTALRAFWKEQHENAPLTWDELKTMEGKPVWIEFLNHNMWDDPSHRVDSEWWVIGEVRKDDIILATYLDEMELCEDDLGVIWQAYRKERE